MRLNPGLHLIDRDPGSVQIGAGPGALVLGNLQPADRRFLAALRTGVPDGGETGAAAECSLSGSRTTALLEALAPVLVSSAPPTPEIPGLRRERLAADAVRLSAAYGTDGRAAIHRRHLAAVSVSGLGRTGALLGRALAAGGIGTLLLRDDGVVEPGDVGGAYAVTDIGMNRAQAVKRHIYRIDPTIRVLALPVAAPGRAVPVSLDLAAESGGATPAPAAQCPQLSVRVCETGCDVGPLVVPGMTPCLECLERHRADPGSSWHAMADPVQDPASGQPRGEETAAALLAAGLAAGQILGFVDGIKQPATWSAVQRLRLADGYLSLHALSYHPSCACRLQRQHPGRNAVA